MLWRDKNEGISMRRLSREVGMFVTPSWGVTSGGLPNEGGKGLYFLRLFSNPWKPRDLAFASFYLTLFFIAEEYISIYYIK